MTYTSGQLIQTTDYNGFVNTTVGANVNATWNATYGQTALSTVSTAGTITATQWSTLVSTISSMASHQGTTITSRTAPVAGNIISVLANVNTDITNCYNNRGNAATLGAQNTGWTGTASFTTNIGNTAANTRGTWTATFTDTMTFANATAANSFFGAGGLVKIQFNKTSTGTVGDTEWNTFVANVAANAGVFLSGTATAHSVAGNTYTGVTKFGGTGTPTTLATTTTWNTLTTTPTIIYKQFDTGAAYSANYIQITAAVNANASPTTLTLATSWVQANVGNIGSNTTITGGTATTGIAFGSGPATVVTYYPPETTYLTNVWGTPTVSSTIANT